MLKWLFLFFVFGVQEISEARVMGDSLLIQSGAASYYGRRFHLRKTSSGEIFHVDSLTAAHKSLPFGTVVKVIREDNGESVWVRINDRLPKHSKRIIDLSRKAARELDMVHHGVVRVRIELENLDELDELIEYFEERETFGLRLRPVARAVDYKKREPIWKVWGFFQNN